MASIRTYSGFKLKNDFYQSWKIREVLTGEEDAVSVADLVKEYNRLASVGRKRLDRMAAAGYTDEQIYMQTEGKLKYISIQAIRKDSQAAEDLAHMLPLVEKLLTSPRGTVGNIKEMDRRMVEAANKAGFYFVNAENVRDFNQYMKHARESGYIDLRGSDRVAQEFRTLTAKMTPEERAEAVEDVRKDFEKWVRKAEKAKKKAALRLEKQKAKQKEKGATYSAEQGRRGWKL